MSRAGRVVLLSVGFVIAVVLVVFGAFAYIGTNANVVKGYMVGHKPGQPVHLVIQTDGAVGTGVHPTWVSYRIQTPQSHAWVHTTLVKLPSHTRIDVSEYQFDSGSPLRNQQWGRVTGTLGGTATLTGKPFKVLDSYSKQTVGHTFTDPALNLNVPFGGVKTTAKNFCTAGPCNPATQENHHITFSFMTPGPGNYRFQCFIPCGAGHYAGNGGPMMTIGYMGGFLEVRNA